MSGRNSSLAEVFIIKHDVLSVFLPLMSVVISALGQLRLVDDLSHDGLVRLITILVEAVLAHLFLHLLELLYIFKACEFNIELVIDAREDVEHHGDHNVE